MSVRFPEVTVVQRGEMALFGGGRGRSGGRGAGSSSGLISGGGPFSGLPFGVISQINDYLYLCGALALNEAKIRQLGITFIINCTLEYPGMNIPGVQSIKISVDDLPNTQLCAYFDKVADRIEDVRRGGGKALVHCMAGVSRSSTLCIAYLMKYGGMTLQQAHALVLQRRPVVRPNLGFWRQLIDYERKLRGANTVRMVKTGVGLVPDVYEAETKNMSWVTTYSQDFSSRRGGGAAGGSSK